MECVIERFNEVGCDFGLSLLVVLNRFSLIKPGGFDVVQINVVSALQGCGLQRKHGFSGCLLYFSSSLPLLLFGA